MRLSKRIMRSIWTRVRNFEVRADPVQEQGVAGGEQLPAPVVDTPPVSLPEVTATPEAKPQPTEPEKTEQPEAKPQVVEPEKKQEPEAKPQETEPEKKEVVLDAANSEQKVEEPKVEPVQSPVQVTENKEVPPPPTSQPEVPSDNVTEVKQEEVIPQPEQIKEEQSEQKKEVEPIKEVEVKTETVEAPANGTTEKDENNSEEPKETDDWQKRESELLKKIEELETVKNARSEDGLRLELKVREEEIDLLKARVKNLEMELQAALSKPGGKNHEMIQNIKQQHEELLSKARGMIFDKTKMVKIQELQIEALTTQVQSLKDINVITKDLLEIRNSEVKAMEERFQAMEARYKAEKERYDLVLKRAQTSTNINDDLRKEYETQLAIFKELREKYELRVQALVAENNRLKESVKGPGTSG